MAYRGVKGSDPFVSKTSRNERFAQMSKQEQIIQQKKLEIQAKMEEQRAKQAVESVKKSASASSSSSVNKVNNTSKKEDDKTTSATVNLFANDGSFLDQFKKIASNKSKPQEAKPIEEKKEREERSYERERTRWYDKNRDYENRRDRRRNDSRWGNKSNERRHSSSSSPSPTRHRGSPPSDSHRHNYHQSSSNGPRHYGQQQYPQSVNTSSIPPLMSQPILQLTNVPPPNIRQMAPNVPPPNLQRPTNPKPMNSTYPSLENARMSVPPPPAPHLIHQPPPQIQSMPPNTNVPPPNMQMSPNVAIPGMQGSAPHMMPQPQCTIPQPQQCSMPQPPQCTMQQPPQCTMPQPQQCSMPQPQQCTIPQPQQCTMPPPPTNLPPPNMMLPPMNQMPPPSIMSMPAPQAIVVTVANVPNIPPPNVIPSIMMAGPPRVHSVPSTISSVPPPNLNVPPPNVPPPNVPPPTLIQNAPPNIIPNPPPTSHLLPTSYPLPSQVPINVAPPPPNVQIPPPIQQQPPNEFQAGEQIEAEQLARIVAECGDEIEQEAREKNAQDPKLWFLHQKQSAAYLQYRGLVAKFRAEKASRDNKGSSGAEPYCPEDALSDNEDGDKHHKHAKHERPKEESKEERKRKRRSRWGDPDNKVPLPTINAVVQQSGLQPGVAIPGQAAPSVALPPTKSKTKNPMLSKISRNDPALIQYARQTFGTLDLSEEQWKKAEDHYKINLLYQNLLKKREEVRRLEAQGKHKYEYDSDEETEGGTWEHKIRLSEMEATQMWAEELTAQAEGKHHIGDFLPPDELKKFMEQYKAVKQGKEPDLSDYKEYKLKEDNIGFQMLQKLGWSEGQGLGSEGSGRVDPVNKATNCLNSAGLGTERPDGISRDDDEFDAYRKRMMLAYRFRPNPLNNPRRPYY